MGMSIEEYNALDPAMQQYVTQMGMGPSSADRKSAQLNQQKTAVNNTNRQLVNMGLQGAGGAQGRDAALMQYDPSMNIGGSGFGTRQYALADMLTQRAQGQNTVAEQQLRQAAQRNMSQQQALAATGRGNAALAARQGAQNAANVMSGLSGESAIAAGQEALGAAGQLGNVLGQGRAQDLQRQQFNAQGRRDMAAANQQAMMQQRGMNDQYQLGMMGSAGGLNNQILANQLNYMHEQQNLQDRGSSGGLGGALGGALGIGSTLGMNYLGSYMNAAGNKAGKK